MTQNAGPAINVAAPVGFALSSPVDFDILLKPKSDADVNVSSLKIEYRLGPAWINLTGRVMKHASFKNNRFYARGADLPKGKHTLRVTIEDTQARRTQALIKFSVVQ